MRNADGDPQFWDDIRRAVSEEDTRLLVETFMDCDDAPSPNDVRPWPTAQRHANDRERDAELANVLSRTEIMVANFNKIGHLTERVGQALMDMLHHPEFDIDDLRSENIVNLLRRLERPFAETAVHTYNLWKEGDGNQRLDFVVSEYLEVFREIMRSPEWKHQFDLTFRPIFDASGERRLIGPACSGLWWERIQSMLQPHTAVGATQVYFDETFQKQNQGMETGSIAAMNLRQEGRCQTSSIKMYALIPTYNADAAAAAGLDPEQIKKRQMEVHQAGVGIMVRDMDIHSSTGSEVNVLCPDKKVYAMPILVMCLAMDHEATEKHCLKAANGCLSCGCPPDEFADFSGHARAPMLVEDVIRRIEAASADLLNPDGTIKDRCKGRVADWEREHKIKLQWNNWFDVSFPPLFNSLRQHLIDGIMLSCVFSESASSCFAR